jgi:hypothetical protein
MVSEKGTGQMDEAAKAKTDTRQCACHPDDRPAPCTRKFATSHCWRAAVYEETRSHIVKLKNVDRHPIEQQMLDYFMRVERALDGTY